MPPLSRRRPCEIESIVSSVLDVAGFRCARSVEARARERCTARHDGRCPGIGQCSYCVWAPAAARSGAAVDPTDGS